MNDTTTALLPESTLKPGGWLAEVQRARCDGSTPLRTYQGMLCDEIVLPQRALEMRDPLQVVLVCNAFVEALQNQCFFIAGEFAPEALWSLHAHDYFTQASTGGHAQYFANRRNDDIALRSCASALKSMLADPHADLFNLMLRLNRSPPKVARKIAVQAGYRNAAAALRDLDRKFAELEKAEPLLVRHKMWLKSLRKLKLVADAELGAHIDRIAAANPLLRQRKEEAGRFRVEHERTDPAFRAARALCEMAGLQFAGLRQVGFAPMRTVWPEGPERRSFVYRIDTDRGPRAAVFYQEGWLAKRRLAVLIEQGAPLPLGSLTVPAGEYASIVPPAPKGS